MFVRSGGSLILVDPVFTSVSAAGGAAGSGAAAGQGIGQGLFLGGNVTIQVSNGLTNVFGTDFLGGGNDPEARGGLTKDGPGTLRLDGANSYGGPTTVHAGTLIQNAPGALPAGTAVSLANTAGATLTVNYPTSFASLTGGGTAGGTVSLAPVVLTVGSDDTSTTFGGQIIGAGASLVKVGAGTLTLAGPATHTGGTTITGGTLQVGAGGTTGSLAGDVVNNGALVFNRSDAATFGGAISGTGPVTQTGGGALTLAGTNAYAGGTTVTGGTLVVSADANLGAATGGVVLTAGTLRTTAGFTTARPVTLSGGTFDVTAGTLTATGAVTGTGGLTKTGPGTLVLGGANTFGNKTTVKGGILSVSADANLGAAGAPVILDGGTLQVTGTSFGSTSRPITLNAGGGTISLPATAQALTLTNGLSGGGAVTVAGAGTLRLAANSSAGAVTVNGTFEVAAGADLTVAGTTNVLGSLSFGAGTTYTTAALTTAGGAAVSFPQGTLRVTGAGGLTVGAGGLPSTALNFGTTLLVTGPTTIGPGAGLSVLGGSFQTGGVVLQGGSLFAPGATVDLDLLGNLSGRGTALGSMQGDGGTSITASGGPLTLGDANSATGFTAFRGTLAVGANAVNLASAGKAKLGTTTTLAGGALASFNGILLGGGANGTTVDASKTLTSSAASTVNGAGGFGGAGTVVFAGGYSPGNSPALVSLGNATFGPADTLTMELGGTARGTQYDAVAATGALALGGTLQLQYVNGFAPADGQSFDLLDWGSLSGTFANVGLPDPGPGLAWDTSQLYRTGVISVTPVPEPGAMALVGLAAAAGGWRATRKRVLRRRVTGRRAREAAGR